MIGKKHVESIKSLTWIMVISDTLPNFSLTIPLSVYCEFPYL